MFILALAAVALGAFLLGRMWRHASADGQQTRIENETTAETAPVKVAPAPLSKPTDSGWRRDWRKDAPAPQPGEEAAPEPSRDKDIYDVSQAAPAVVVRTRSTAEQRPLLRRQPTPEPEPQPPEENNADESPTVPSRIINLPDAAITLHGAGATFPHPIYSMWFDRFHKIHPQVTIEYQSKGSGAGIRLVEQGQIDFGATDGALTDQQLQQTKAPLLHIPTVLNAVVPIYNIPDVSQEVRFTPQILAGIFLGRILYWDDPAIAQMNPDISFPNVPITVIHRADATATTYILTDYLAKVSREWNDKLGRGTSISWPTGLGQQGNEAVGRMVREINGGIGYVDLIYALQNKVPFGSVKNRAGKFVKASMNSLSAAAASAVLPPDFRASITDAPGSDAYPIASFTWLLVPSKTEDQIKTKDLQEFLRWMLRDGQSMTSTLGYAPLPPNVVEKVSARLERTRGEQ